MSKLIRCDFCKCEVTAREPFANPPQEWIRLSTGLGGEEKQFCGPACVVGYMTDVIVAARELQPA